MASHRKAIRAAVVEVLKGPIVDGDRVHATAAGERVFPARILPIQSLEELPCLLVYTGDERSEPTGDGLFLDRTCTLTIEGAVSGDESAVDGMLDDLAEQVEAAIDADPRLAGLLSADLVLKATMTEVGSEGHTVMAGFRMDYDARYMTRRVADDTLADFVPRHVWSVPDNSPDGYEEILGITPRPVPQSETACGPDGCDIPAWQGELEP